MAEDVDRDLQRRRKLDDTVRPIVDEPESRVVDELKKYRDLIDYELPKFEIIKKRKLVR